MLDIFHIRAYKIINKIFAGIIIAILLYSGIFSAQKSNYPIPSACTLITGQPCKSTGLSRAFSEIVRLNFDSARKYNSESISIFSFFLLQLFLRILSTILLSKKKLKFNRLLLSDIIISVLLFMLCFKKFLFFWQS